MARVDGRRRSVRRRAGLGLVAILLSCSYAGANNAFAQGSGCTLTTYTDPPRQVLQCRDGLEVSAESAADYSLINGPRGRPAGARLQNRGLFIDLSPGRPGGFQISTPHAVASVRGTRWAVDVSSERTSVFVRDGLVDVRRQGSADFVRLRGGDGVDVEAGQEPLRVTRWSAERAALLLGRFGL
jgi:ferric-dicitrate binding protein FerR (iron transport regulator)